MTVIEHSTTLTVDALVRAASSELDVLEDRALSFIESSRAPSTIRGYRTDWRHFSSWCDEHGVEALPASPRTVASYLSAMAGALKVGTLQRRLVSISQAHKAKGLESPTSHSAVRSTWKGIRRTFGIAPVRKAPLRSADIRALVATLDTATLTGLRDRTLLVVGFAGAFRRSELAALDVDDITETAEGLVVHIRRSKTDQEGEGQAIGLPYGSDPATCPVRTLRAWLDASSITEGPIFRHIDRHGRFVRKLGDRFERCDATDADRVSGRAVAERVKRACRAARLDPSSYGGHSLRAGLITSAIEGGATEHRTMQHSRHKSVHVFRGYIRDLNLLDGDNPVAKVGL